VLTDLDHMSGSLSHQVTILLHVFSCLFLDLHVSLPFANFMIGVLKALNVNPTQLHPNTWASIQAFRLICDVPRLHPTPSCFLSYYASHPAEPVLWHSLISQSDNVLFNSYTTLYKKLKKYFSKFSSDRKPHHISLMKPVGRGFLCLGLGSLRSLRSGLVRPWVPKS